MKVMVVAGEASGDLLGAGLMQALKSNKPELTFVGLGGEAMEGQGLQSAFPMREVALMGLVEVVPHIPNLIRRINQLVDVARIERVKALVTIDSPDLSFRIAKKVKAELGIPCIHYVSPHVWAWRRRRVYKMAKFLDHVLALFPFEPQYYEGSGLKCTHVGHAVVERLGAYAPRTPEKPLHQPPRLALAPGSRLSEITRLMPPMADAIKLMRQKIPDLEVVLPLADAFNPRHFEPYVGLNAQYVRGSARFQALMGCDAALAASGTMNLELAMLGIPMVAAYKLAPITYALARELVQVAHFSPVNLVADKRVVPELLQKEASATHMADLMLPLLMDTPERKAQQQALAVVRERLGQGGALPSERAAEVILGYLP